MTYLLSMDILEKADAICFLSYGNLLSKKRLNMRYGSAKMIKDQWPSMPKIFGDKFISNGNVVSFVEVGCYPADKKINIVSFPVREKYGKKYDKNIIENSIKQLIKIIDNNKWNYLCISLKEINDESLNEIKEVFKTFSDKRINILR